MEFIIVLGCLDPDLKRERVKKAVEYFHSIKPFVDPDYQITVSKATLVFSGKGRSGLTGKPEAINMYNYALTLGVQPENCIIEDKSMNTHENILFTSEELKQRGYFKPTFFNEYTFTICTSEFHVQRAFLIGLSILSKYGTIKVIGSPDGNPKQRKELEDELTLSYLKGLVDSSRAKES